jgi:hypothetical protein
MSPRNATLHCGIDRGVEMMAAPREPPTMRIAYGVDETAVAMCNMAKLTAENSRNWILQQAYDAGKADASESASN